MTTETKKFLDLTGLNRYNNRIKNKFNSLSNDIVANAEDINNLQEMQDITVKKNEAGSVSMNMLTQQVKEALTGGSTAVVGIDSVNSENIVDKAVTIIKLDDNLRDNFDINCTKIDLGEGVAGWYKPENNEVGDNLIEYNTSDNRIKFVYNLEVGKTYRYTGYNPASEGCIIGTDVGSPVIAFSPNNGKLNKDEYTGVQSGIYGTDFLFTVSSTGLKAFITQYNDTMLSAAKYPKLLKTTGGLFEVTSITPYDRTINRPSWKSLTPSITLDNSYMQFVGTDSAATLAKNPYTYYYINSNNYKIHIYPIHKNHKYKAVGQQRYTNAGFALYDNSCKVSYVSLEAESATVDDFNYEFTATNDGFAIIQDANSLTGTLYESDTAPDVSYRMTSKVIAYNGDSITESRLNTAATSYNGGAYPKLISDITDSTYYNFAVGGATLAYAAGGSYHRICREIDNMSGNYDAIIFSGGINDYWQNIPLGTFTPGDYSGAIDDSTLCGGLESIFRQAINKWCGKPIMFVITHKVGSTPVTQNTAGYTFNDAYEKIVAICNKYSIPYYDCYKDGGLNGGIAIMNTTFMTAGSSGHPDGTHPNESAYMKYYVPQVIEMIERNLPYPTA